MMGWHPPSWISVRIPRELRRYLQAPQSYSCNYYAPMVELADMGDSKPLGSNTVQVQVLLGAPYYAPLAQLAEATGLSPVQSEFESLERYQLLWEAIWWFVSDDVGSTPTTSQEV